MRIALHPTGEAGRRAGLILLAEADLVALGLYGYDGPRIADRRTMTIGGLEGFDLLVTDDPEPTPIAAIAAEDGLHCVAAGEVSPSVADDYAVAGLSLVEGAGLAGLAATLAVHEAARVEESAEVTVAWTVPGKPLRRGIAVGFPEPVGARWGRETGSGVEVPIAGPWAAAAATVRGRVDGSWTERLVGVADDRLHLEGITLAAAALVVARGLASAGRSRPPDFAAAFLSAALGVGLGVATHVS